MGKLLPNVAELLFNLAHNFELSRGGEGETFSEQKFLHVVGKNASGNFHLVDGVGNGEALEDGHGVGDTITSINDETCGAAAGVEGHDGLDCHVHILDFEGFEHDLSHLLSVGLGVERSLSE